MTGDTYTHGHHESVLRSHRWRTAENSAAYLLPHLVPGESLLDVGCGPGTITVDLAERVAPGHAVGLDRAAGIIEQARADAPAGSVEFVTGDVYGLDFDDGAFDVVHAHQVLQHLTDPVGAFREMRRVLAPGGLMAVRDSDYGAFVWAPADPLLDRWLELYHQVTVANSAEADAGRRLPAWVAGAGFEDLQVSSSTWTYTTPVERAWWGDLWADRARLSDFADQAVRYDLSDPDELAAVAGAWRRWAAAEHGFFAVMHVEVLARRSGSRQAQVRRAHPRSS